MAGKHRMHLFSRISREIPTSFSVQITIRTKLTMNVLVLTGYFSYRLPPTRLAIGRTMKPRTLAWRCRLQKMDWRLPHIHHFQCSLPG